MDAAQPQGEKQSKVADEAATSNESKWRARIPMHRFINQKLAYHYMIRNKILTL